MKFSDPKNFCRVFELPKVYPSGFCFGGGIPVTMRMVDWFHPWPDDNMVPDVPKTWDELQERLRSFLQGKIYVKPGRTYILITDFGESMIFGTGD